MHSSWFPFPFSSNAFISFFRIDRSFFNFIVFCSKKNSSGELFIDLFTIDGEYLGVTVTRAMILKLKLNHHKYMLIEWTATYWNAEDIRIRRLLCLKCEDLLIVVELCDTGISRDAKTFRNISRHRKREIRDMPLSLAVLGACNRRTRFSPQSTMIEFYICGIAVCSCLHINVEMFHFLLQ